MKTVVASWALAALLQGGCSRFCARSDPSRYFMLTPLAAPAAAPAPGLVLGVGPITFPRYLDRPEIVTRIGPNELRRSPAELWAGSLAGQFEGTLRENLERVTGAEQVEAHPWPFASPPDVALEVDVRSFELASDGQARLAAGWRIRRMPGRELVRTGESALARPAGDGDSASTAAALSAVLGDFSREVGAALVSAAAARETGGARSPRRPTGPPRAARSARP